MGNYFNPDNDRFQMAVNNDIYVDKSELIQITNSRLNKGDKRFIYVSRPRRFGKSTALNMLCAYYSKGCRSEAIFNQLAISQSESYQKYLNRFNVIYADMQKFLRLSRNNIDKMLDIFAERVIKEISNAYSEFETDETDLPSYLEQFYCRYHAQFIILIDEWDCVFRTVKGDEAAKKYYLDYLSSLLKEQPYVALAYVTGILPIKQYGNNSVLNMFDDSIMTQPYDFAPYIGLTSEEVKFLCEKYRVSFDIMKSWYDGYKLKSFEMYCPRSVISAIEKQEFKSYWTQTETYEALSGYIAMDFDGLHSTLENILAGQKVFIDPYTFANDMFHFKDKDDILTLLVHLGYLGYDGDTKEVFIPNKEIADEFVRSMRKTGLWKETINAVVKSRQLLTDTLNGEVQKVAAAIEEVHENVPILSYNNEQSLRFVILLAYYYAREQYNIFQEMPSGDGYADIVFLPKPNIGLSDYLPLVIELKWNQSAETAIRQIKNRKYIKALSGFDKALLVGINYDKNTKKHECMIEEQVIKE